jgi:phage baseplate assembly protein W
MTDRTLTGYRFVSIDQNDTLQAIAARELGDASKWADLVNINGLTYPYLTGDPTLSGPNVRLYGQTIIVPAATVQLSAATDPDRVFGVDLRLTNGQLTAENGDFALVKGRDNLKQAYQNRIATPLGELLFHLLYGCGVHALKGFVNGPTAALLAARYVKDALLADPRTDKVTASKATVQGDVTAVEATAQAVGGTSIDISAGV